MSAETTSPEANPPVFGVMTASRLPAGSHLVLHGLRLWKTALIEKHCVFAKLNAEFSDQDCTGAIRYIDELMCLMFLASRRQPSISSLYQNRLSNDEFRVLNAIRLLAENKAEGAVHQLGDLVRGPLNFSMIRVCADIIRILQSKQLGFQLPVRLTVVGS